ncbi:Serine/threonine-protein phosphatase 7 long form [Sesamum angolense]|uniref:Serine/threonine-protein phosphatase 7 long form n=1 Tax=Sesamum angolense TaxID=2727404 RepID=A0AAE2BNA8_9LAMI|nr:Serine/threonine-protein phosphatase 7 long form [Sesamum angolense]
MENFGPIDTSVLYGQANHRSEDVLGDPDTTLTCGHIEIDTHLITALVERWHPETHTFHFSVGEATVTLQDISIIWALPIEGNIVSLLYLRHMKIIDEERPSNWGTSVLAYLYRELCMASQRGKTNIGGAMQLLQIWAWSRIITLAPIPSNNAADLMPTVIDLENILPIPPYAARDYIVKWNDDVQSMLVVRPEIVNGRGTVPDYMNWYHQITRVQISHNIGSTDITGYRPTDTRDWEYVYNRMEQLVLDCDNSGDDIQSLRETRARNRVIGRDIMTF